jgi:hypothetical protein
MSSEKNVNLLWTGGWDSTFQLLQLLILHRCHVTPFYLIEEDRPSTGMEIHAMKHIKDHIYKEYPHTQELLHPTRYFAVEDIPPDPEISETFQDIFKRKFMGIQYEWLARFCKENAIEDLQLCIHRDDKAHSVIEKMVSESNGDFQSILRVDEKFNTTGEYILFRYYTFPIFNLSKIEMASIANEQGWNEIMAMTWFCHTPRRGVKPCGVCGPCVYTIQEGLGWRVPVSSRILSFFVRSFIRPSRSMTKRIFIQLGIL